ncbi:unnamed protein product [Withania somnifera]
MDMSRSHCSPCEHNDDDMKDDQNDTDRLTTLSKEKGWRTEHLYLYKSVWLTPEAIKGVKRAERCFKAQPTDIFLVTFPKSGTWFKALIFSLINRDQFDFSFHPLLSEATHIPYSLLSAFVMSSASKFLYVFRNTKDVLVSNWHFAKKFRPKELPSFSMEDAFDLFCKGVIHYGPFWDHVLGYWKASLDKPFCLERRGCAGSNRHFLSKGQVGDWINHLTQEMAEQLDEITMQKFGGTTLIETLFVDAVP